MSNKYSCFKFKKFSIQQTNAAMKIGTDGILLGAWAEVKHSKLLLDIGTGTGVIALMQAQKNKETTIDALEIDINACIDAKFNFEKSPWKNRITLHQCSLEKFNKKIKYDTIISNPPFYESSLVANTQSRTVARHTSTLHYNHIIEFCKSSLSSSGNLSLILPVTQGNKCIIKAQKSGLYLKRKCNVFSKKSKLQHRLLLEFSFKNQTPEENNLIIENEKRHDYTDHYKELTKDFYIIFD
ncbi:MAG: methyltransferase [Flavobacteriales bacterium]|jgi:tRNA1Val (adenine37-N6)-methyltransferase|nr:methyltransferase [Flavobacteriales bacterium]